ncbi:MAG: glycosyltransferase [bacterium]
MKSPKVSVVIAAFNRAGTLSRSLKSVLDQTEADFEIIVVDDGSTDNTLALIPKLKDSRIRWETHGFNRGAAAARNTGVRAAKGKWIAFLDSDDEWLPGKLEAQLRLLSEQDHKIGVCTGYYLKEEGQPTCKRLTPPRPFSWHKHLLLGCDLGPGTTLMVAREAFEQVGFLDEGFRRLEDWEWLLRFVKRFRLETVPEPLAIVHRQRHARAQVVEEATWKLVSLYENEARRYGLVFERRFRARRWLHLAWLYSLEGNIPKGSKYFIKAILDDPAPPPGMILLVLDAFLGTKMAPKASLWRSKMKSGLCKSRVTGQTRGR